MGSSDTISCLLPSRMKLTLDVPSKISPLEWSFDSMKSFSQLSSLSNDSLLVMSNTSTQAWAPLIYYRFRDRNISWPAVSQITNWKSGCMSCLRGRDSRLMILVVKSTPTVEDRAWVKVFVLYQSIKDDFPEPWLPRKIILNLRKAFIKYCDTYFHSNLILGWLLLLFPFYY